MNPSGLDLPMYQRFNSTSAPAQRGYAWGLLNAETLGIQPNTLAKTTICVGATDKLLVNLGTRVHKIVELDDKLSITYTDGDICNAATGQTFTSRINLICDVEEGDGWPTFVQIFDGCEIIFQWKSRYACSKCTEDQTKKVESKCYGGEREVREFATENCILVGIHRWGYWEECSEIEEIIKDW